MGQSLALYRVAASHLEALKASNKYKAVLAVAAGSVVFDKTFQGLEYLLTKAGMEASTVSTLLYPSKPLDEDRASSFRHINMETATDDELLALYDYHTDAICYTAPPEVEILWNELQRISPEQLGVLYSSQELNEQGIYPRNWHDNEGPDYAFNRSDTVSEYRNLRAFYEQASAAGNYVFSPGVG